MSEPLVSIIIPSYNRGYIVETAINSVLKQTYRNIEIILVDDGSKDNTRTLIMDQYKYEDKVRYIYQENKGLPGARNTGIRHAQGELIGFLDSDDYYLTESVKEKVEVLTQDSKIGWVYSDLYYPDEDGKNFRRNTAIAKFKNDLKENEHLFKLLLFKGNVVSANAVLIRKECFEPVGMFDENIPFDGEEYEFFLRLAKYYKAQFIDKALCVVIDVPGSMSKNRANSYYSRSRLYEKILKEFPEEIKQCMWLSKFNKGMADIHNYYGLEHFKNGDYEKAKEKFLKSICTYPLQRQVYYYLMWTFLKRNICPHNENRN